MKKILLLIILVLIANTYAGAVTIDGINYSFSDPEHGPVVAIVGSGNYSGHLIIPSSVTYQGQSIPVKTIGWNAFSGCNGLLSIAIPKSVSFLGLDYSDDEELPMYYNDYIEFLSFEGCDKLATISIDNDNTSYSVIDNCIVKGNHLVSMFKNGDIPDGITSIGRFSVYKRSGLSSITIPSSVEKIFIQSFINCKDLSSITILGSPVIHGVDMTFNHSFIIDYSEQVFDGCDNLKEAIFDCTTVTDICAYTKSLEKVTLMEGVTNIISNTNDWCEGERGAFERCTGLTSIIIPNSVTTIGDYAFYSCTNLASVVIGNSVTSIGSFAFSECSSMISLTIGNSVTSIGMAAFGGHSALKLKDVYCLGEKAPPGFDNLLDYIFDSNDVSNAILHVKDYAIETFKGKEPWTFFKEIVCDEKVTDFNLTYYVDNEVYKTYKHKYEDEITPEPNPEREEYTFSGWSEIPNVMPGKDVNVFGTFNHDEVILNGVTYQIVNSEAIIIDNANISGELSIPSSVEDKGKNYPVKNIPSGIFTNNSGITSLIIADGIISIGARAFSNCSSLTSISIPNSVTSIGERAFANIDKLTDVTCYANEVPQTDRTAFEKSYLDYVTLHVPYESLDAYNAVGPWKDFKEIVSLPRDSYTLTYMVDDETYKAITYDYGEEITAEATPMKEGYTFSGWSEIPKTMPDHDVTVNGTFTINKYKLIYMVDDQEYKSLEIKYNSAITPEADPTKEGYNFLGWSEIPEIMPAHDVTVTGSFERRYDIGSVTSLIGFILRGNGGNEDIAIYDMNGNGVLDVGDLILVVRKVLNSTTRSAATRANVDCLSPDLSQYSAAQFVLNVPADVREQDIQLVKSIGQTHQMMCKQIEPGAFAVVIYSLTNSMLTSEDGSIIEVNAGETHAGDLSIQDVMFAKPTGETKRFDNMPVVTVIFDVKGKTEHRKVYDLKGQKRNRVEGLQKGIYIENGKKIVVR
jgi:hypothetical protein